LAGNEGIKFFRWRHGSLEGRPKDVIPLQSLSKCQAEDNQEIYWGFRDRSRQEEKAITAKSEIKIRLQGIDTPELHYPALGGNIDPTKRGTYKNEFRQPYGAAAANALHKYLQSFWRLIPAP
jgi:endonuclease YncB( thermonuclease family)